MSFCGSTHEHDVNLNWFFEISGYQNLRMFIPIFEAKFTRPHTAPMSQFPFSSPNPKLAEKVHFDKRRIGEKYWTSWNF